MPTRTLRDQRGFSLVEMLVSTTVLLGVTGAVFSLLSPSSNSYKAQPEAADMQQRMRVGANAMYDALLLAGAGSYSGTASVGTLAKFFSPIVPYRTGTVDNDPELGVVYRPDAITILYVPQTAAQTEIREDMPQPSAEIKVTLMPGCPLDDQHQALCGFEQGMRVVIFDDTGSFDPFTVTGVQDEALHLQHRDDDFSKRYLQGATVTQVEQHTYYLRTNVGTNTFQLMHYDGYLRDEPLVDNVVGLGFTYFGEPNGPLALTTTTPATSTYGPNPPPLTRDLTAGDEYPAGESCLFTVNGGGQQVSRLANLAPGSQGLIEVTAAMLQDGPWCPNAAAPNRFDADMFRVRRVGVRLRVQVASADLRGPAGVLFSRGGTSTASARLVPDQDIRFEVAPRNLNLGR